MREIERRIQKAANSVPADLKMPEAPVGVPESFDEHFKIMFDLQVLAFKAEITRIATMMYARDTSGAVYPQSGVRDGFHVASHHSNNRANMDKYALINKYHVQMLAYFLGETAGHAGWRRHPAGPFDDPLRKQHEQRQPARSRPAAARPGGRSRRQLKGGRHLQFAPHTPMSNLLLSMLDKLGVRQPSFGDSTGNLEI